MEGVIVPPPRHPLAGFEHYWSPEYAGYKALAAINHLVPAEGTAVALVNAALHKGATVEAPTGVAALGGGQYQRQNEGIIGVERT